MDKLVITHKRNRVTITGEYVSLDTLFQSGQSFRFKKNAKGFFGVAYGRQIQISEVSNGFSILPTTPEEMQEIWTEYFDLSRSYQEIEERFAIDPIMRKTLPYCRGMRLLKQEPFETLVTFIISANNNEARIRKIVEEICRQFGTKATGGGYAFPTPKQLSKATEEELVRCGCGYRARYIAQTAKLVRDGFDICKAGEMEYTHARDYLQLLPGIGPKVADCILLFAFRMLSAFPRDVWIVRILQEEYHFNPKNDAETLRFINQTFGEYAGIAQQYLFHYARMKMRQPGVLE